MANSSPLKLWCLSVNADHTFDVDDIFVVMVQPDTSVAILKDIIKSQLAPTLDSFSANHLKIWTPRSLLPIADPKAIEVAVGAFHLDRKRREQIADKALFLAPHVEIKHLVLQDLHLHIIVQLPSSSISPSTSSTSGFSPSTSSTSGVSDSGASRITMGFFLSLQARYSLTPFLVEKYPLAQYWDRAWGQELPLNAVQLPGKAPEAAEPMEIDEAVAGRAPDLDEGVDEHDVILYDTPLIDGSLLGASNLRYLVRAEYIRMYDFVEAAYRKWDESVNPPAVVITGQPGIGKSVWITYVVRRRLGRKLPTILYQNGICYRFTESGVIRDVMATDFRKPMPEPPWCIVDSLDSRNGLPDSMRSRGLLGIFPIYVSSPDQSRWSDLQQARKSHLAIMNPWTWKELEHAARTLHPNADLEDVRTRFYKLGPTARICLEFDADEVIQFEQSRQSAIDGTQDIRQLLLDVVSVARGLNMVRADARAISGLSSLAGRLSHKICLIRRPKPEEVSWRHDVSPMSKPVVDDLFLSLQKRDEKALLELWRTFSKFPNARGMTSSVFEAYVHQTFRKRIVIHAQPMFQFQRYHALFVDYTGNPLLKKAKEDFINADNDASIDLDFFPSRSLSYDSKSQIWTQPDIYYQPNSETQVGIDAFFIHSDHLYLLQYTGGAEHSLKGGLATFIQRLQPPITSDKWRFIFVVPDDLEKFSCPAPIGLIKSLPLYLSRFPISDSK